MSMNAAMTAHRIEKVEISGRKYHHHQTLAIRGVDESGDEIEVTFFGKNIALEINKIERITS